MQKIAVNFIKNFNITIFLFNCMLILVIVFFASCSTASPTSLPPTNTFVPSFTEDDLTQATSTTEPSFTPTFTQLPTSTIIPTSTSTPIPTLSLPFLLGTPIPKNSLAIEDLNVEKVQEIARWTVDILGEHWNLSLSPDGNFLAAASPFGRLAAEITYSSPTISIWDIYTGEQIKLLEIENEKGANKVVFSPDGEILAAHSLNAIQLWKVSDWTPISTFRINGIRDIAFTPDGKTLAYSLDYKVRSIDIDTEKIVEMDLGEFKGLTAGALDFSPDGQVLIGGIGNDILFWEPRDGKQKNAIKEQEGLIYLLKFSPDGDTFLSASGPRAVRQWHSVVSRLSYSQETVIILWGYEDNDVIWDKELSVDSFTYSPDGEIIAITYGYGDNIQFLRASDGELLQTLIGHNGLVQFLAFTPDSKYLISASKDGTIRIWGVLE